MGCESPRRRLALNPHPPASSSDTPPTPSPRSHSLSPQMHHPSPSSPSSPSTMPSPLRPPSSSERLLRDTLLRDELKHSASPPPTPTPTKSHRRRHSHAVSPPHDDDDAQYTLGSFLFRTALSNPPNAPAYRSSSPSPSHSPSPGFRRKPLQRSANSESSLQVLEGAITPHELVLRARLERVLYAGSGLVRAEERVRGEERERARERKRSNEVRDEVGGWPWREKPPLMHTPPNSSDSLSNSTGSLPHTHHRSRSQTDPTPTPTPSRPPHRSPASVPLPVSPARSPRISPSIKQLPPPITLAAAKDTRLLTPPPTPPLFTKPFLPRTHPRSRSRVNANAEASSSTSSLAITSSSYSSHSLAHSGGHLHDDSEEDEEHDSSAHRGRLASPTRPQFNARKASARIRQMDGYVSFAAIEGLGQPPESPMDDDVDGEGRGRGAERRGLGRGGWRGFGWQRWILGSDDEERR